MIQEIRIYYESIEQAYDYLLPMITAVFHRNDIIKLVKRPKRASQVPKGSLSAILYLTTPDALITGIVDEIEYPLLLIEFTEAVKTEDHELQRTYGAVAAYLANIFYIKISGHKKSEKEFGGAEYNPYLTPKILIDTFGYEGFIIAEWATDETKYNLIRNKKAPSCPPSIPLIQDTIQAALSSLQENGGGWFLKSFEQLKKNKYFIEFRKKVDVAGDAKKLLLEWKAREERNKNKNKIRYFVNKSWIGAKINRFSHAMDPDRGILTFISFVFSNTYKIFGIYSLVRPRGGKILKGEMNSLETLQEKFKEAINKDGSGIPNWFIKELNKLINLAKSKQETIDFQTVWEKHFKKIRENKVITTIAFFLDGMYLNHNGIKVKWDRRKLLGKKKGDFIELLKNFYSFTSYSKPAELVEEKKDVNEDEVTYAIVHRVMLPNNFTIISISYPGSQGGGAILPEPSKGKAQPREYPDVIAMPPKINNNIDVIVNESKGMFKQKEIEKDIEKILRYQSDEKIKTSLSEMLVIAQIIDKNDTLRNIIIGVAFGISSSSNILTTWNPNDVNFIFRITDRKRWSIGIFSETLKRLIPNIEGDTEFPIVYKISSK